tara:strand:+ start:375 stop:1496 length:1122 start_codon:yes stop_codon:yes gene_type:complete
MTATLQLTEDLIRIPSITPKDEGCLDLIIPRLEKLGFTIELFPCEDAINLWARLGDATPLVCLAGHTDVVATGDLAAWTSHPFKPEIRDGMLYGRGAADMKSGLAAMIVAVEEYLAHNKPNGSIAFLITSAEEGPSHLGTPVVIDALEQRGEKIDYCIVGEPSSSKQFGDTIKNGRRGSLTGQLVVQGKQGHIAYPHLAENPIHSVLKALDELVNIEWDQGNNYFEPTSLQISNLNSGTGQGNVIPGTLQCDFNFRYSPEVTAEQLTQKTLALLDAHKLNYDIEWTHFGNAFLTEEGKLTKICQQVVKNITGITPKLSTGGGTSDARYIAPTGAEVIELGVINKTIHQVNECASVNDIDQLKQVYLSMLQQLC